MTAARERLVVVLGILLAGALAVLASTQTFATATLAGARAPVVVAGSAAAPALAPLGIVALALGIALTIAGRAARVVLGAVLVLIGAGVVASALPNVLDDAAGTKDAVVSAIGVTDVAPFVLARAGTAWPVLGVVAGALAVLLGLVVLVRGARWSTGGRRFRSDAAVVASTDPISEWDALSRGADPTDAGDPADPDR
ncbi:Trp biosynthesis-associated membrane protein [Amnibacterium kyonggiense]|uniref:Tryptophan-associated transmembrane protein n=1 Tax=Amnibacterium kyonggiense TaxID=595671 RepID=A0A4R7FM06_9MICO|nr:Trp biosynthesis-associated membrane protein [Amnibacterium kyonggiense]TDS77418.1 tryptophan-associated transmembrane protein [Amnibacterium kyonggiense]